MSKLTIKMRLVLTLGFMSLLLVVIGGVGLRGMEHTVQGLEGVYHHRLIPTDQIWHINDLMRTNLQQLLLAGQHDPRLEESQLHESDHHISMHLDAVKGNILRIGEIWQTYVGDKDNAFSPEEQALAERYEAARGRFVDKLERAMEMLAERRFHDANVFNVKEILPSFRDAKALAEELVTLQRKMARNEYQEDAAEYASTRNLAIASIVVGVLLAVAAGYLLIRAITVPLGVAIEAAGRIARGDLSRRITVGREDETGRLLAALKEMHERLREVVTKVRDGTNGITASSSEIARGNSDLSQRTEEQASSLEETASSMEEMTSTVKQNADNAQQANRLAVSAREQAEQGGSVVARAVQAMGEINESSKRIADIIGVIDEIAFQTNLLALNAAVEAARAGEQGRGFAVVAGEVRNLAQRSAEAAKEIKALIQDSVGKVEQGSQLVADSGTTLEAIVAAVKKVTDIVSEIAAASQEQASGIDQVNKAVVQMDEVTQQNAALVEEAAAASRSLEEQAQSLREVVSFFEVEVEGEGGTAGTGGVPRSPAPQARAMARRTTVAKRPAVSARKPATQAAAPAHGEEWDEF